MYVNLVIFPIIKSFWVKSSGIHFPLLIHTHTKPYKGTNNKIFRQNLRAKYFKIFLLLVHFFTCKQRYFRKDLFVCSKVANFAPTNQIDDR
jgi:hypothetical protein